MRKCENFAAFIIRNNKFGPFEIDCRADINFYHSAGFCLWNMHGLSKMQTWCVCVCVLVISQNKSCIF